MTSLDLDIARRFLVFVAMLQDNCDIDQPAKLLDLGGYPGTFAKHYGDKFPNWEITTADTIKGEGENFVHLTSDVLPFEDDAFDYVISSDVLEHVPPPNREIFLTEMVRVTKKRSIICFPYKNPLSEQIEKQLADAWKDLRGSEHPWLKEHLEYGLPDLIKVLEVINPSGKWRVSGGAHFHKWMTHQWYSLLKSAFDDFTEPCERYSNYTLNRMMNDIRQESNNFFRVGKLKDYYRVFINLEKGEQYYDKERFLELIKTQKEEGKWIIKDDDPQFEYIMTQSHMYATIAKVLGSRLDQTDLSGEINSRLEASLLELQNSSAIQKSSLFSFLKPGKNK